jgi:hypothetical protein
MKTKNAALSIIQGIYDECQYLEWIGPRLFDVWGMPKKRKLNSVCECERKKIFEICESVYKNLCNQQEKNG